MRRHSNAIAIVVVFERVSAREHVVGCAGIGHKPFLPGLLYTPSINDSVPLACEVTNRASSATASAVASKTGSSTASTACSDRHVLLSHRSPGTSRIAGARAWYRRPPGVPSLRTGSSGRACYLHRRRRLRRCCHHHRPCSHPLSPSGCHRRRRHPCCGRRCCGRALRPCFHRRSRGKHAPPAASPSGSSSPPGGLRAPCSRS